MCSKRDWTGPDPGAVVGLAAAVRSPNVRPSAAFVFALLHRYWTDMQSAQMVDQKVQHALFMFACTNSCMNPIVYGAFNIRTRRTLVTQVRPSAGMASAACTAEIRLPSLSISVRRIE